MRVAQMLRLNQPNAFLENSLQDEFRVLTTARELKKPISIEASKVNILRLLPFTVNERTNVSSLYHSLQCGLPLVRESDIHDILILKYASLALQLSTYPVQAKQLPPAPGRAAQVVQVTRTLEETTYIRKLAQWGRSHTL